MKLLVLDLDETLIHATAQRLDREPDFSVGPYFVYTRPGLASFLNRVQQCYKLAVWTSSSRLYADAVVPIIFAPKTPLEFVWSRERCTRRFDPEQQTYGWTKNLGKLKRKGYTLEDVLMLDDTPAKLAKHYGNLVRVRPFIGDQSDTELIRLAVYLPQLAEVASVRSVEKRNWRSVVVNEGC